jgi:hypothetical protein
MGFVAALGLRSFSSRDALSHGNYDLAVENGVVYLLRHHRAAIGLPSPWVMCRPADLLNYQSAEDWNLTTAMLRNRDDVTTTREMAKSSFLDIYTARKAIAPSAPPGVTGRFKAWLAGPSWAIPVWTILAAMLIPIALIMMLRSWRWLRNRPRPRGFPVELNPPQAPLPHL